MTRLPFVVAAQIAFLGTVASVFTLVWTAAAGRADLHLPYEEPAIFRAVVTAYSSSEDETWGDPFVTASGRRVAEGVIACPRRYAFGTQFRIGRRVYACWDRLHQKFDQRFDIWMSTKEAALEFGKRRLLVEVL